LRDNKGVRETKTDKGGMAEEGWSGLKDGRNIECTLKGIIGGGSVTAWAQTVRDGMSKRRAWKVSVGAMTLVWCEGA